MTRSSSLERIAGAPLRALTRFGGSGLAERLGLIKPAQRVIVSSSPIEGEVS